MCMSVTCAHVSVCPGIHVYASMCACLCEGQKTSVVVLRNNLLGSRDGSVWDLGPHLLA